MRRSVLVVDDEPDARSQLETFLTQQGYDIQLAINGQDALLKLEISVPDLIILDLMMPVMDGFDLLAAIRDRPALATIPVLATSSGFLFPQTQRNVFTLRKPFDLEELAALVKRTVESHHGHDTGT